MNAPPDLPIDFMESFTRMVRQSPITFTLQTTEAWAIVALLQLASRHSGVAPWLTLAAESFGRQLQAAIDEPQMRAYLEMGWHPEHDVERHP